MNDKTGLEKGVSPTQFNYSSKSVGPTPFRLFFFLMGKFLRAGPWHEGANGTRRSSRLHFLMANPRMTESNAGHENSPVVPAQSLFQNSQGACFRAKSRMARRDEGAYPPAGAARGHHGATKPDGLLPENPPGGGSFVRSRRWLVPYSPLRALRAAKAALATAKIPRRRPPANFKAGSWRRISYDRVPRP